MVAHLPAHTLLLTQFFHGGKYWSIHNQQTCPGSIRYHLRLGACGAMLLLTGLVGHLTVTSDTLWLLHWLMATYALDVDPC